MGHNFWWSVALLRIASVIFPFSRISNKGVYLSFTLLMCWFMKIKRIHQNWCFHEKKVFSALIICWVFIWINKLKVCQRKTASYLFPTFAADFEESFSVSPTDPHHRPWSCTTIYFRNLRSASSPPTLSRRASIINTTVKCSHRYHFSI